MDKWKLFFIVHILCVALEDKVAMAIAVIPREGVKFIRAGEMRIAVE